MSSIASKDQDWLISALLGSPTWFADSSADPLEISRSLLTTAREQRIASLVCHSLGNGSCWSDLPEPLRQGLRRDEQHAIAWEIVSREIVGDALSVLSADGIDFLLLKGIALAHMLYPEPHQRAREDTDLLVANRETADRVSSILMEFGFRRNLAVVEGRFVSHQFTCTKPGPNNSVVAFDVHWLISNSNFFAQKFDFERLWAERRAIEVLGPRAATLSARHALIHAIFHRAFHLGGGDAERLIWLYDIHLLCSSFGPKEWEGFVEEVDRCGLQPICLDGLQDVSDILGTSVPFDVIAALSTDQSSGLFDQLDLKRPGGRRHLADLMSLPTWADRLAMIRELLFPDADYMQRRFGADKRWKLPFAYLSRAVRGVRKRLQ